MVVPTLCQALHYGSLFLHSVVCEWVSVHVCECVCMCVRVCIWKPEADLQESVLSIHNVTPGARTQVVGFSGKYLYPQSHLTSP